MKAKEFIKHVEVYRQNQAGKPIAVLARENNTNWLTIKRWITKAKGYEEAFSNES